MTSYRPDRFSRGRGKPIGLKQQPPRRIRTQCFRETK